MARRLTAIEKIEREIERDPRRRANVERDKAALRAAVRLHEIRTDLGLSQAELARRLGITQGRISRIERAEDLNLSTLQRYVAALGGRLEVQATFGDQVVSLTPDESEEALA